MRAEIRALPAGGAHAHLAWSTAPFRGSMRGMRALVLVLFALLSLCQLAFAEPLRDGPYLMATGDGQWTAQWVEGDETDLKVKQQPVRTGQSISVPAVGELPEFTVRIRKPDATAPDAIAVSASTPLFVVADSHGQYEHFAQLLQNNGVIDQSLRWSFRKGHVAILGDVFDRGPNQTEILWLIYKLEEEAAKAGGGVHFVLGNHEFMVLSGDLRYLHPKYSKVAAALQAPSYTALWSEQTLLGQWLRTQASVIKLGDYLCLHGGISPAVTRS